MKMKKYLLEIDENRWLAFKMVALRRGLTLKAAITEALDLYVQTQAETDKDLKLEIVKAEPQRNLRAIMDEMEISTLIKSLIERRNTQGSRPRYDPYAIELRQQLLEKLKKGVVITDKIAEELQQFVKAYKDDLPPELIKSITQLAHLAK